MDNSEAQIPSTSYVGDAIPGPSHHRSVADSLGSLPRTIRKRFRSLIRRHESRRFVNLATKNDAGIDDTIAREQLKLFVIQTVSSSVSQLVANFDALQANEDEVPSQIAFTKNPTKNRYTDVPCNDATRVILAPSADNPGADYIHANWITIQGQKRIICTQGPLDRTINDFWKMVYQERAQTIIMLTGINENGRIKCSQYWPEQTNVVMVVGDMEIKNKGMEHRHEAGITLTMIEVKKGSDIMLVEHFFWDNWIDHGIPSLYLTTIGMIKTAARAHPCVIHCSAGVGRAGTFICLDWCLEAFKAGEAVDIVEVIRQLRRQRSNLVQNPSQFLYIYMVLLRYAVYLKVVPEKVIKEFFAQCEQYVS